MARCEDFPCCGHENGCCPDLDAKTGEQLNMICTCGAVLPVNAPYSICSTCMKQAARDDGDAFMSDGPEFDDEDNEELFSDDD